MIPNLAMPFRVVGNRCAVVDQTSDEAIGQRIEAIVRTRPGDRLDLPDFGVPDETFLQGGPNAADVRAAILKYEPKAQVLITTDPSQLDEMVGRIRVQQE